MFFLSGKVGVANGAWVNSDIMEVPKKLPRSKEPNRQYLMTYACARLAPHFP